MFCIKSAPNFPCFPGFSPLVVHLFRRPWGPWDPAPVAPLLTGGAGLSDRARRAHGAGRGRWGLRAAGVDSRGEVVRLARLPRRAGSHWPHTGTPRGSPAGRPGRRPPAPRGRAHTRCHREADRAPARGRWGTRPRAGRRAGRGHWGGQQPGGGPGLRPGRSKSLHW